MVYLFLDTETSGLPIGKKDPVVFPEYWPHLVQIAWILCESESEIIDERTYYVYPKGYAIPESASRIHGITTEIAIVKGIGITKVLESFHSAILESDVIIGHNVDFDIGVVTAEYSRLRLYPPLQEKETWCTMRSTTDFCKISKPSDRRGYKWPTLSELHSSLFSTNFEDAHDAMIDAKVCKKCFFELMRRGVI